MTLVLWPGPDRAADVAALVSHFRRHEGLLLTHTRPLEVPEVRPGHVALSTSGTTGLPRWVELSEGALVAAATACLARLSWGSDERWMLSLSWAHAGGLSIMVRCLVGGGEMVQGPAGPFDPKTTVAALAAQQITRWSLVPTQLVRLVRARLPAPPSLRSVLIGGAAASPSLLSAAAALGWPVLPSYGLTETCGAIVMPAGFENVGCGHVLDGNSLRLDGEGRIELRGAQLLSRYLDQEPRAPDAWLKTSDVGRLDGGRLEVLGRADDVIVTGGEKVWPGEVEAALTDELGVRAAVVFGVADAEWGHVVEAVVEADSDGDVLRARLRERLLPWKIPRHITVVPSLPTLANGKIDRRRWSSGPNGGIVPP